MPVIKFINTQWASLIIQIRKGATVPVEDKANDPTIEFTLINGEEKDIPFDVFLFYRRDSKPLNTDGTFTAWSHGFTNDETIDNP